MRSSSPKTPPTHQTGAHKPKRNSRSGKTTRPPKLVTSALEMQKVAQEFRQNGKRVGFVPTMGALHEGHLSLVRQARASADVVVVSIFVNPLQFGKGEDLSRYPRTFERDRALCQSEHVDIIFVPPVEDMYPEGFQTRMSAGKLARPMEGMVRPGHFNGMLTVVAKLFQLVLPEFAVFGEKDFQQLRLVQQMVRDFFMPVEVVAGPVVREADGLAMSSRNRYLPAGMRRRASVVYRALAHAQEIAARGDATRTEIVRAAQAVLDTEPKFSAQYVKLVNPDTLVSMKASEMHGRLLIAGHLGQRPRVRLIDNVAIEIAR